MSAAKQWKVRLTDRRALSGEVFHLSCERTDDEPVAFRAGQYICLGAELSGETAKGYYSLASAPSTDGFDLCVRVGESSGVFGRFLAECEPRDTFFADPPAGNFLLRKPLRESVFVVHGTGIAPVRSMLGRLFDDSADTAGDILLTLLQGARTAEDLYYREEFEHFEKQRANFQFRPVLSQGSSNWSGRGGHAQEHLPEALAGRTAGIDVYLCGRPEMVRGTTEKLVAGGFDEQAIVFEKYG